MNKDKLWHPELIKFLPDEILYELHRTLLRIEYLQLDSLFTKFVYDDKRENFYKYYLFVYEEMTHRNMTVSKGDFDYMLLFTQKRFDEADSQLVRTYDYHNKTLNPYPVQLNDNKLLIDYYELQEYYIFRTDHKSYPNELYDKLRRYVLYDRTLHT